MNYETVKYFTNENYELGRYDERFAQDLRILYGGSVMADNAAEFIQQLEIDGALVGGASLKADQFVSIIRQTEEIFFPTNPPTKDLVDW